MIGQFKLFEITPQLFQFSNIFLSLAPIFIQKMIQIQGFVKVEIPVILLELVCVEIPLNALEIANQNIWRPADPCCEELPLAVNTLISFLLKRSAFVPSTINVILIQIEI